MQDEHTLWQQIAIGEQLIEAARQAGDTREEGDLWLGVGATYTLLEQFREAGGAFERAIPLFRAVQERARVCRALAFLGNVHAQTGHYLQALPRFEEALALAREVGDETIELECLSSLSFALTHANRPQEALPHQQRALELVRRQGDRAAEVNELGALGITYAHMGLVAESLACHEQALALARQIGDRAGEAFQLGNLGSTHTDKLGEPERGAGYFTEALAIFQELEDRRNVAFTLTNLAGALARAARYHDARAALEQARAVASALGDRDLLGLIASQEGKVSDLAGQVTQTISAHQRALLLKKGQGEGRESIEDLSRLGMALLEQRRPAEALALHREALDLARSLGDRLREAQQLDSIADALHAQGHAYASWSHRLSALTLFRELGDLHGEGICYVNMGTACLQVPPWGEIRGNKRKALAAWRMGHTLLAMVEQSEAGMVREKIEAFSELVGEAAYQRLLRASEAYLRWLTFQRCWLVGDVLQSSLHTQEIEGYSVQDQQVSSDETDDIPLQRALRHGDALVNEGNWREARVAFQEALGSARDRDDRFMAALLLGSLGCLYARSGMWEEAATCFKQTQELFHALADTRNEMKTFQNLAAAQLKLLMGEEAISSLRSGWYLASLLRGEPAPGIALRKLGVASLQLGDANSAKSTFADALTLMRKGDGQAGDEELRLLVCLGVACVECGQASRAAEHLEQAVLQAQALFGDQQRTCACLSLLATARAVAGKFEAARCDWARVQAMLKEQGDQTSLPGQVSVNLALTFFFQQRPAHFLAHVRKALDLTESDTRAHTRVQQIMDQFEASLRVDHGAYQRALEASTPLYHALGTR